MNFSVSIDKERKPVIGISCHADTGDMEDVYPGTALNYIDRAYADSIAACGMIPVLIPVINDGEYRSEILNRIDGLICSGGGKKHESQLKEKQVPPLSETAPERYYFEKELYLKALDMDMPIIGMCRGMQMMNEILGGTMFYSIKEQIEGAIEHNQSKIGISCSLPYHDININEESHLFQIFSSKKVKVNSLHLQSVKEPGSGLHVVAVSDDHVVEALESVDHTFVLLTQFHPELLIENNKMWNKLFSEFKNQAILYQSRR